MFCSIFLYIVATAKTLLPQKWRMWRQGTFWLDNADIEVITSKQNAMLETHEQKNK
jgi:hypothetical protein